jgi:hypothetical protein
MILILILILGGLNALAIEVSETRAELRTRRSS